MADSRFSGDRRLDAPHEHSPAALGRLSETNDGPPPNFAAAFQTFRRDASLREAYLDAAWSALPRLLASVDRNPFGPSYGSCDRQYWHYRTASFPSEMYQEAALAPAMAYALRLPGNRWFGEPRLAEIAVAIIRYSAASSHADGSCDDYYPFERALGAAVFSLQAQAEAYRLLGLDDAKLLRFFETRAEWIAGHDETGRLTNHHALAALALWRTGKLTGRADLRTAALERVRDVVDSQHAEGWYPEYDGADPGYQTVTIDCLAKLRRELTSSSENAELVAQIDDSLHSAVDFASCFQHRDGGFGGEYGSRGTRHFYPHGMELLAPTDHRAAELAENFLRALADGTAARFDDDRMYVHRAANLIEAYVDWSSTSARQQATEAISTANSTSRCFPAAGLAVFADDDRQLILSTARGGTFCYSSTDDAEPSITDAGLVVELADGRVTVSQTHGRDRQVAWGDEETTVTGPLRYARFERVTPWKQALLQLGMCTVGRVARSLCRSLLQRRVIRGGGEAPLRLTRRFECHRDPASGRIERIDLTETLELLDTRTAVRRLAIASDLQAAYTAASQVYHPGLLQPWRDLGEYVGTLNTDRQVTICRTVYETPST
jgi:hypothetical protein